MPVQGVKVLLCLAAVGAVGLQPALGAKPNRSIRQVTEADNGKTITVTKGDEVDVSLPGNAGTGYSWAVASMNGKALKLAGTTFVAARANVPGSSGAFLTKFAAKRVGETNIKMHYSRPWEKKVAPAKTFALGVKVNR